MINWNIFGIFGDFGVILLLFLHTGTFAKFSKILREIVGVGIMMMMISMCTYDNDNLKLCNITIICNQSVYLLYVILISFSFPSFSASSLLVLCPRHWLVPFLTRRVHNTVLLSPRTCFWRQWGISLLWCWFLVVASLHFVTGLVRFWQTGPFLSYSAVKNGCMFWFIVCRWWVGWGSYHACACTR